jgi:hypothetical protein
MFNFPGIQKRVAFWRPFFRSGGNQLVRRYPEFPACMLGALPIDSLL